MTIIQDSPTSYISITPVIVSSYPLVVIATRLYISVVNDNLSTLAVLSCVLTDESKNVLYNTQLMIAGTDYSTWDGDNNFPFTYAIGVLNLVAL